MDKKHLILWITFTTILISASPAFAHTGSRKGLSLGILGSSQVTVSDHIDTEGLAPYGGGYLDLRWRMHRRWALEFQLGGVGRQSEDERIEETRYRGSFGGLFYMSPSSALNWYLSWGIGYSRAELVSDELTYEYDDASGYFGVGFDIPIGPFNITLDWRMMSLMRTQDNIDKRWEEPYASRNYNREAEDVRMGMALSLGFSFLF